MRRERKALALEALAEARSLATAIVAYVPDDPFEKRDT